MMRKSRIVSTNEHMIEEANMGKYNSQNAIKRRKI